MTQGALLDGEAFEQVYAATGNAAAAARAAGSAAKTARAQAEVGRQILAKLGKTGDGDGLENVRLLGRHPVTRAGIVAAGAKILDMSVDSGEGFTGATAVSSLRLIAQVAQLLVEQHDVNVGMQPSEAIAAALRAAEADQSGRQDG